MTPPSAPKCITDLQKKVRETGPFVLIFWQQTEVAGLRKNVQGFKLGPTFDTNFLAPVTQVANRNVRSVVARSVGSGTRRTKRRTRFCHRWAVLRFLV